MILFSLILVSFYKSNDSLLETIGDIAFSILLISLPKIVS